MKLNRKKKTEDEEDIEPLEKFEDEEQLTEPEQEDDLDNEDYDNESFSGDDMYDDYGGGGATPLEKHNDLLKDLTNFDPFLKEKINGWLGLTWNEETSTYVQDPDSEPIMNKKCARWCADYLKTYTRNNNIITNINVKEYTNLNEDIIEVVWKNIGTRSEEFGIKKNGDIFRICVELEHAALLVLMGAGDGKYNQLLSTVTNRHESINVGNNPYNQGYNQPIQTTPVNKGGIIGRMKKAFLAGG